MPRAGPHLVGVQPTSAIRARYPRARIRLIRAREAMGLSPTEFARVVQLSRFYIWNVEYGFRTPRIAHMMRWAKILGEPLDIFALPPAPKASKAPAEPADAA